MSEFVAQITVSTLTGEALNYNVDLGQPGFVLKYLIQKDTGITIRKQKLFFNKVINK